MILGKNYWCADSPGLQVCKSASLQSASVAHRHRTTSLRGIGEIFDPDLAWK